MSKAIPKGLTKQHVLSALADLDAGVDAPFGPALGYELVHDGKRYAPKAVIGLAFQHLTGQILDHEAFRGGEATGQANYVLRALGFSVMAKTDGSQSSFITSRGFALPTNSDEMSATLWFNMWKLRMWPYNELEPGGTLYWYDTNSKSIVWKSHVTQVERFEYPNKEEVRKRFLRDFGIDNLDDPYFDKASDQGYCLAYKVDSLVRLDLKKPSQFNFPMTGWLRCSELAANEWLKELPLSRFSDGPSTTELTTAANQVDKTGYFSPASWTDERERAVREIVQRRGQPGFRSALIAAYNGRCAVTGSDAVAALEAAHIRPYSGPQSNHVTNGLLLRADIHTLFDLDLIGIDPELKSICVASELKQTEYAKLDGQPLMSPLNADEAPNGIILTERWRRFRRIKVGDS